MIYILKGDVVRTACGSVGEVTEIWGHARTLFKLQPDTGKPLIFFESAVVEAKRKPAIKKWGR
ncbi:hypothetical protein BBD42_31010 [Paenibacillus sp. BIHB 4019]|uniref:DUF2187 domain-containing protein n=1 Tax=Paenibacillus sp. BIHB 4019 TaxID=1870819 RepID=A0A1B2DRV3_9BACL|nr:hypothetical protein [Paenibacillus sp. BIHB 4019]ANY70435.1 hypothetical protein BBD42_31010 [Paenibacillus sp. BIHB 4019]